MIYEGPNELGPKNVHHYYRTPIECDTAEKCWEDLSAYLEKYAKGKLLCFKEVPKVFSERDFDTKKTVHRGFVRFTVIENA